MAIATIAFRNLSRQKRRSFLLAGAIAFGVFVITAVNGVAGGFLRNVENNFSTMLAAHIMVLGVEFDEKKRMVMKIDQDQDIRVAIETLSAKYPFEYFQKRTSVFNGATLINQSQSTWLQIDGVDWKTDKFLAENLTIKSGSLDGMAGSDGIVLGERTAKKLNVQVGESVLVQAETIHGQQNVIEAPVRALFKEEKLSAGTVYMDKAAVNNLLDMPVDSFNWYGIFLSDFDQQNAATAELATLLESGRKVYPRDKTLGKDFNTILGDLRKDKANGGRLVVANLNDQLSSLAGIFEVVKLIAFLVLVVLLAVTMVGLYNTFRIIVWERSREIGTMRALGVQRGAVSRIFLLEAMFLSLSGVVIGIVLATVALVVLQLIEFGGASDFAIFLSKNHVTWTYDWPQLVTTVILVALLSFFAALAPARKAARVDPAVALRTTA